MATCTCGVGRKNHGALSNCRRPRVGKMPTSKRHGIKEASGLSSSTRTALANNQPRLAHWHDSYGKPWGRFRQVVKTNMSTMQIQTRWYKYLHESKAGRKFGGRSGTWRERRRNILSRLGYTREFLQKKHLLITKIGNRELNCLDTREHDVQHLQDSTVRTSLSCNESSAVIRANNRPTTSSHVQLYVIVAAAHR